MQIRYDLATLSLALTLATCGEDKQGMMMSGTSTTGVDGTEGMSSSPLASTSTSTSTAALTSTSASTLMSGDTGTGEMSGSTTTNMGPQLCDVFAQDCPEGQACKPTVLDGDTWNTTVCTPLDANPGQLGEPCTPEDLTGVDSCDEGLLCWWYSDGMEGTCLEMCKGDANNPQCPQGMVCNSTHEGVLNLCFQACDPLMKSCPDGQMCAPLDLKSFYCELDISGDMGTYSDPCEYVNDCDDGFLCTNPDLVPGCFTDGCCSPFCDLTQPNTCPGKDLGQECRPWYESNPPPGQEHIGVCATPF